MVLVLTTDVSIIVARMVGQVRARSIVRLFVAEFAKGWEATTGFFFIGEREGRGRATSFREWEVGAKPGAVEGEERAHQGEADARYANVALNNDPNAGRNDGPCQC